MVDSICCKRRSLDAAEGLNLLYKVQRPMHLGRANSSVPTDVDVINVRLDTRAHVGRGGIEPTDVDRGEVA